MLKRRILLAAALTLACARGPHPAQGTELSLPERDEPRELAVDQQVKLALDRLTFGPRPDEAAAVLREGLDHWLIRQLTPEQIEGLKSSAQHYMDNAKRFKASLKKIA